MKTDLTDYIKTYKGWYEKDFCDETVKQLSEVDFEKHTFYNFTENSTVNVGNDCSMFLGYIPNGKIIFHETWNVISKYYKEDLRFPWFDGWHGYSSPKFNRYDVNNEMKEHCDHIYSLFEGERRGIPLLTVLTSLNDDYSGGDLVFFTDRKYELNKGDVMIFPSNFLYPHRIDPITEGQRFSAVSWVW